MMEWWNDGMMEWWNDGMMEWWNDDDDDKNQWDGLMTDLTVSCLLVMYCNILGTAI